MMVAKSNGIKECLNQYVQVNNLITHLNSKAISTIQKINTHTHTHNTHRDHMTD